MSDPRRKIFSREAAIEWRRQTRRMARTLVFTNGVFDLLHTGHVDLLVGARLHGDDLLVGVNSDASVRRLNKGADRPVRSQAERAYVLAALEPVTAVVIFDEDTPLELVRAVEPDVIAKGGDYTPESIVGADDVRARGGRVVVIPLTAGHSTTLTIEKLRASERTA